MVRLILAVIVVAWCYFGVTVSLADAAAERNPAYAHRLAPYDGRVTAALAASLSDEKATRRDRQRADALAWRALRQDPMAVAAAATIGIDAETRGDHTMARRMLTYARMLSRRDVRTGLWAIEDAVARDDIVDALRQYDIALRVKPALGNLLFPILMQAGTEPAIRGELVRTLAARPLWASSFIDYAAANATSPGSVAALLLALRRAAVPISDTAQLRLLTELIAKERIDEAWTFYAAFRPGADPGRSRDPEFAGDHKTPLPFDWMAVGDAGISGSIRDGAFDFVVPASIGGPVLQQLQRLPPGEYRLAGRGSGVTPSDARPPHWVLSCFGGADLGRVTLLNDGIFEGSFRVPTGCPLQMLTLVIPPTEAVDGLYGRINQAALEPIAGARAIRAR